jgi:hypothetical protein
MDIVKDQIRTDRLELNTSMPGIIKEYDPATRTATVQPAMKRTTVDNKNPRRPLLLEVPVIFPYSGTKGITFPLEVDSPCLLVFSQRSIDDWVTKREEGVVTDTRLHDINDAFCIPGPNSPDAEAPKDAFQINHDKIWVGDTTASDIPISTTGSPIEAELIQIVTTLLALLDTDTTPLLSSMGPVTFATTVVTDMKAMKTALEALTP